MLKIQVCWSILRYFHYDDDLNIIARINYFHQNDQDSFDLSHEAIDYLLNIHAFCEKYMKRK